ncbi:MAG TPA: translocation/assembly module TamB domain-containing protein [Burkholderiales bacterium]|nr:translocation/assembly module TamB domain-containing protein [Burkholderiales bacterium]
MKRIDAPGTYKLSGRIDASSVKAELVVDEPAQGLLAGLANLPDLGALSVQLSIDGPRNAEAMRLALAAGPLRASGQGRVDLVSETVDLDVTASAPAMAPRQDLRWQQISLQTHVHGTFTRPDVKGQLRIDGLNAGGGHLRSLHADLQGNRGAVSLHAVLDRLSLPGPKPELLQSAPVDLRTDVRLDDPRRPVTFAISHRLISAQGQANTSGPLSAAITVTAPALAPFAAIAGIDLKGQTIINANVTTEDRVTSVNVNGTVGVTGGMAPVPALLGNAAKIDLSATLEGQEITIKRAQVNGQTLHVSVNGTSRRQTLDLNWQVALSNLAVLTPTVSGRIEARGRLQGAPGDITLTAEASGEAATAGFPRGPITASTRMRGLPSAPSGRIEAHGTLDGAPLQLAVALERARDGALRGTIERADWKSAHAEGNVFLRAGDRAPQGRVTLRVARLDELRPWIGHVVQGSVSANVDFAQVAGRAQAKIEIDARNAGAHGIQVDRLTLAGSVDDPMTHPIVALKLAADGIAANGISGSARVEANGPQEALQLKLSSDLRNVGKADLRVTSTASLNVTGKQVALSALQAEYQGQSIQLLAPARVSFRDGLAIDRLRVGMQQAALDISGRVYPTLDMTASLRNVTSALAKILFPDLQADGILTMDGRFNGTLAQPRGTVRVSANGLHMRTGPGRMLPAAQVIATAELNGQSARVDAQFSAGSQMRLNATGQVPLAAAGPTDLRVRGSIDAAIANPILEVNGRRVKGQITVDLGVRGALATPRVTGNLRLAGGEIQDHALGAHLNGIEGLIEADGDTIRIASLTARAGPGTLAASGSVGVLAPGRPVDLKLTARNAQPLATDLLTANMDADLTLRGQSQSRLDAAGSIKVNRATINIPKALPPTIAVLDVRRPGQKPPAVSAAAVLIGYNLKVDAPSAVFVRGRGLDAEVGGALHVGGTSASPQISGGLDMRRGTFDLAGTPLKFTSGKVSFNGTGLTQKIDPTLDFEAESLANNITAKLNIRGYADAPKIALTSIPELPQDEVLAHLLFGVSVKQLTTLQIAQIGMAVATLGGVSGGGVNPLMAVQKSLGLDRLSVGKTATSGASVEAGRYVSSRVYVGGKQSTAGSTQAQVQVDLTKHLKMQATLGTGGTAQGATPENDPGSSIGLSYQFEY